MQLNNVGPVVLVGAGKMGLALARGWIKAGLPPKELILVDPQPAEAAGKFAEESGVRLVGKVSGVLVSVLVLAVKPQVMGEVLEQLRPSVGRQTLVVSIAAGISIATIAAGLGTGRVVRAMPNTPAQIGRGISGAVAGPEANARDREVADALLGAAGEVVWLDKEAEIDAVTAVSGSGPAYLFHFVEALASAAMQQGFDEARAMQFARATVIGAAALMEADPTPVATLRQNVTSPKGTTEAALSVLMAPNGLATLVERAVLAARLRSEELGRAK
ncbi:MAG TPA: pyrroline-5-carboxylate reductase [Devosia sp.]|nr:pyrroline-5-carboxylate reductase [Devosia sp.]